MKPIETEEQYLIYLRRLEENFLVGSDLPSGDPLVAEMDEIAALVREYEVTEQEYNKARVRLEEIIDLVDDEVPEDDPLWQELVQVSNTIEVYEEIHYAIGEPTKFETLKRSEERRVGEERR